MHAHRTLLPLALVAGLVSAPNIGAASSTDVFEDDLRIARSFAPPGSPDDGDLEAHVALTRLGSQESGAAGDAAAADADEDCAELVTPEELLPGQRYPWRVPRSTVDCPDERSGRLIHIVYLVPANMPDDAFDEKGIFEDSVRSMNHWMRQQTGNRQWRFDTRTFLWDEDPDDPEVEPVPVEVIDVTFIRSNRTSAQLAGAGDVRSELIARGFNQSNKRYLSFVASNTGNVCGDAWWTPSPSGSFDGKYSQVYLYSSSGCRARDFATGPESPSWSETIAMQEMIHNDGVVTLTAPHGCQVSLLAYGHVCTGPLSLVPSLDPESVDVMFPYVGLPLNQKVLDRDRDDYFRHPFVVYRDLDSSPYLENV